MAVTTEESDRVTTQESPGETAKWLGWPGYCVFRLIVPVAKVGSIIGRKGDLIKKLCEDTRARIRVLDGPPNSPDRVVLISGKEKPEAPLSPAMDATLRVFKRVSRLPEGDVQESGDATTGHCSIRLLVASTQAINLIGKQGSVIKSIQETTGAALRVLSQEEAPSYVAVDERIVDLQGEALLVLKALEATLSHLRKFLVDHTILPLFEKNYNEIISQDCQGDTWTDKSFLLATSQCGSDFLRKREALLLERDMIMEQRTQASKISLYGQDPGPEHSSARSSALSHNVGAIVTQMTQTMQMPISYAEEIIGMGGRNIAYIRHTSGALISVSETRPDEMNVEINGTSKQVQLAQQLIEEILSNHKKPVKSIDSRLGNGLMSAYHQLDDTFYSSSSLSSYTPSSLSGQPYSCYEPSAVGSYNRFRL